jgi:hypothetical protein
VKSRHVPNRAAGASQMRMGRDRLSAGPSHTADFLDMFVFGSKNLTIIAAVAV